MRNIWFVVFILLLNVPFGYWRQRVRKFGLSWVLAIHLPVLIIIASRVLFHMPYQLITLPFNVGAFFLGQLLGGKIRFGKE
jgi:hypothetical protein